MHIQQVTQIFSTLTSDDIRQRLEALHGEELAWRAMLRSVLARERQQYRRSSAKRSASRGAAGEQA